VQTNQCGEFHINAKKMQAKLKKELALFEANGKMQALS
jgi:hypothetical protein